MFRWLNLLLLFCFIKYRGSPPAPVTGIKGGDVILSCDFEAREVSHIDLNSQSKKIFACQKEECESENGRVFKEGSCDVIIKNLTLRDAGKYILSVYYTDDQTELERLILEYQLHIQDEISVNTGEELKMDVLLANAEKVEHQSNTEWTEVWTRGHRVSSDRLTDSDGTLTIKEFKANDTGTYRVLDYEGEILITVTVTESNPGSDSERTDDKPEDTEQHLYWFLRVGLPVLLLVLVGVIMFVVSKKRQRPNGDYSQTEDSDRGLNNNLS